MVSNKQVGAVAAGYKGPYRGNFRAGNGAKPGDWLPVHNRPELESVKKSGVKPTQAASVTWVRLPIQSERSLRCPVWLARTRGTLQITFIVLALLIGLRVRTAQGWATETPPFPPPPRRDRRTKWTSFFHARKTSAT